MIDAGTAQLLHRLDPRARSMTYLWRLPSSTRAFLPLSVSRVVRKEASAQQLIAVGASLGEEIAMFTVWPALGLFIDPKVGDRIFDERGDYWSVLKADGRLFRAYYSLTCRRDVE